MSTPDATTPSETGPADVAVVTVSFGSEDVLHPFLASIPSAGSHVVEVVVVDNRPDAASTVSAMTARVGGRYLPIAKNAGYGGGINTAIATLAPSVKWVLVSNPDVVLHPGAIDRLVDRGAGDARIAAVGPAIYTAEGEVYPSARAVPSLRTGVGHALLANSWESNPWTRAYRREAATGKRSRDAGWLSGACVLVRRTVFDELRGFDESYFMYFEDVDLGYRIGRAGYRSVYEPSAEVTHTGAHSTSTDSDAMLHAHHRSARLFLHRRYDGRLLFPVRIAISISLEARSWLLRRGRGQKHAVARAPRRIHENRAQ